jgi:hypothetical protein
MNKEEKPKMDEMIFKSKVFQILIPLDTTIFSIIDSNRFTVKDFGNNVILVEQREEDQKE